MWRDGIAQLYGAVAGCLGATAGLSNEAVHAQHLDMVVGVKRSARGRGAASVVCMYDRGVACRDWM